MPGRGIAEHLGAVWAELGGRVAALAERSHPFGVARAVVRRSGAGTGSLVAGHLAYRMFLLLLPLGAVVVALAGIDSVAVFVGVLHLSMVVGRAGLLAGPAAAVANTLASFVAFFALSWILSRRCREWFWLLPGAAVGAAGVLVLQLAASPS